MEPSRDPFKPRKQPHLFFRPPFPGLLFVCWLYFGSCFVLHPQSPIMHGRFVDPDDIMYALQSSELLDGQAWYDMVEHRMDPPVGAAIHYSRLLELCYAATIGALTPALGRLHAIFAMAAVWPPLFLLALLFAMQRQARLFLPKSWIGLTSFFVLLMQGLLYDFAPGHIDHHGFGVLIVAASFGAILTTIARPLRAKPPVIAGCLLAFSVSVALESLPWVLAFSGFLGVWASLNPLRANAAKRFGTALVVTGVALLPTYRAGADLLTIDLTSFSFAYIILLSCLGFCFWAVWALRAFKRVSERLALAGIFAATIGGVFLTAFPDLLTGPYGAVSKQFVGAILPYVRETTPLIDMQDPAVIALGFLPWPLVSLIVALWQVSVTRSRRRQMWLLIGVTQIIATALTLFCEERYISYAQLAATIPLAFLTFRMLRGASAQQAVLILSVFILSTVGVVAFLEGETALDIALYPMLLHIPACDVSAAAEALQRPAFISQKPRLILNGINEGADLLLATHDAVLSAPFHENIAGNMDALQFFQAADPRVSESIIRRRGVDFVLLCKKTETMYLKSDFSSRSINAPSFAKRLLMGEVPEWLIPIVLREPTDMMLFQVKPQ